MFFIVYFLLVLSAERKQEAHGCAKSCYNESSAGHESGAGTALERDIRS